jgi:multisubunit Na+/H+ antiporter MnhG subunit
MKIPIILLLLGMLLILIGAFLRITKFENASIVITLGLIAEVAAVILFFLNRNSPDAKIKAPKRI